MDDGDFSPRHARLPVTMALMGLLGAATACKHAAPAAQGGPTPQARSSAADALGELQQRIDQAESLHFVWTDRHPNEDPPHVNHGELWLSSGGRLRLMHVTEMGGTTRELHVVGDGRALWFWGEPGPAASSKAMPAQLDAHVRAAMLTTHGGAQVFRILGSFMGGETAPVPVAGEPEWLDEHGLSFLAIGERTVTVQVTVGPDGLPSDRVFIDAQGERHHETIEIFDLDAPVGPTRFEPPPAEAGPNPPTRSR